MRGKAYLGAAILMVGFAGLVGSAQENSKNGGGSSVYAELGRVPESSKSRKNPLREDPEAPVAGGILFEEHCEQCHGVRGAGGRKAPSLRASEVQEASDGAIFWILSNGIVRKRMPVWSKLPEPQRWQLVSYVKSLGAPAAENGAGGKP